MLKARNKKFSLIMALVFAFTMVFPFAAFAGDYNTQNAPVVDDDGIFTLGSFEAKFSPGELKQGDMLNIRLPEDFEIVDTKDTDDTSDDDVLSIGGNDFDAFNPSVSTNVYGYEFGNNTIEIPKTYIGDNNALYVNDPFEITALDTNEFQLKLNVDPDPGQVAYFRIKFGDVYVDEGFSGDIEVFLEAAGDSTFNSGSVTIGRVSGGEVDINVINAPNFGDDTTSDEPVRIRFSEDRAGGLDEGESESIKLVLPDGFEWQKVSMSNDGATASSIIDEALAKAKEAADLSSNVDYTAIETAINAIDKDDFDNTKQAALNEIDSQYIGNPVKLSEEAANDALREAYSLIKDLEASDLEVTVSSKFKKIWGQDILELGAVIYSDKDELIIDTTNMAKTTKASAFELTLGIKVADETDAEIGDVIAEVKGESAVSVSEIKVGTYGQYEITMSTGDVPTIYAGQLEQIVAKIKIDESVAGSLVEGRSLLLTLPNGAKWGRDADMDEDSDNSAELDKVGIVGDDGRTYKWTVPENGVSTSKAGELELSDMEVMVEPGFEGDLVVEVGGTLPIDVDELTIAKVVPAVSVTADIVEGLIIGRNAQDAGDITITEAAAGLIKDGKDLVIDLPEGVEFNGTPEVTVTEGDLEIDDVTVEDSSEEENNLLVISIEDDSTKASTIVISGIKYLVDRTVAEGEIEVSVKGNAVNEVNDKAAVEDEIPVAEWDDRDIDEDGTYEGQVFPHQDEAAVVVNAKVGTPAPEDQVLSTSVTLGDNGSYISDGRIMVQLRDAAKALGVAEQNIFWDNATKTATFIKGDRVAQLTVGDPQVKLNGVGLPTDKGAELKDGRTYVSLSAAGVALGATASWDNTTKTATLTIK